MKTHPPLLGIAAYSGTGKTTLLKQLIPLLRQNNLRVGLIKHTHHDMEVDTPGKDSYELRKAGAEQTLVASDRRWALMVETPEQQPLDLHALAQHIDATTIDLILVEGFKHEAIEKIALYRPEVGKPVTGLIDNHVIAVASNIRLDTLLPQLDIDQPQDIAAFILAWCRGKSR